MKASFPSRQSLVGLVLSAANFFYEMFAPQHIKDQENNIEYITPVGPIGPIGKGHTSPTPPDTKQK